MNSQAVLCLPHSAPPHSPLLPRPEAYAYTDGASTGSRGPGGYGVVIRWEGKTKEISGGELNTTNLRMELAACVALETIGEGYTVSVYSDASYLINCMRRGWYKKDQSNQCRESASSQTPRLRGSLVVGT